MLCTDIRDVLTLYARAKLPAHERAVVAAHLSTCPECRHELERIRRVNKLLYEHLERQPVRGQIESHRAIEQRRLRRPWLTAGRALRRGGEVAVMAALGGALMVLIVSVGILGQRLRSTPSTPAASSDRSAVVITGADTLRIEAITPAPGTVLTGNVPFEVQFGYQLVSVPQALLSVRVAGQRGGALRYFSWAVPVRAEEQHATVHFTMDAGYARQLFGSGTVQLEAVLRAPSGASGAALLTQEQWPNIRYKLP